MVIPAEDGPHAVQKCAMSHWREIRVAKATEREEGAEVQMRQHCLRCQSGGCCNG